MAKTIYNPVCLYCNKIFESFDKNKKFCNLSCATYNKNKLAREKKNQNYLLNPNYCKFCNSILAYSKKLNYFCSSSCSARYSNVRKDYTKFKPGPKRGASKRTTNSSLVRPPYTKISQCEICNKFFPGTRKTCSVTCKNFLISRKIKLAISNGYNPKSNRGRHKKSYLESSFEHWLLINNLTNFITEKAFRRHDIAKTYFVDFYFPNLNLVIELDGTQHKNTKLYDQERDQYITFTYGVEILRISHKEYIEKTKIEFIKSKLGL